MSKIKLEEFQNQKEVKTEDSVLTVTVSADNPLPIGPHIFELQVVDDSGNISKAVRVQVVVRDTQAPTAVLNVTDAEGRPLPENVLEFGVGFILNAKGSIDIGSGIASYTWRIVS